MVAGSLRRLIFFRALSVFSITCVLSSLTFNKSSDKYPQTLVLALADDLCKIDALQILSHESKISQAVTVYVGSTPDLSSAIGSTDIQWTSLGYFVPLFTLFLTFLSLFSFFFLFFVFLCLHLLMFFKGLAHSAQILSMNMGPTNFKPGSLMPLDKHSN